MSTLDYLRRKEWSMGHGQCPECCGGGPSWFGDFRYEKASQIGHKVGCGLALAIEGAGGKPVWIGTFEPTPEEQDRANWQINFHDTLFKNWSKHGKADSEISERPADLEVRRS